MKYRETVTLKNGSQVMLRNGDFSDGQAVFEVFNKTHEETDFLLSYSDENSFNEKAESEHLAAKTESPDEIEILAVMDNKIIGMAGIDAIGSKYKVKHRAEFGISVLKDYWGLGIGKALTAACIKCAKEAGYVQLELDVVSDNTKALEMYRKFGFKEFGRNPKGFNSRISGYQELIYMLLEL